MIIQFIKIEKKVNKIAVHWEEANIIGSQTEINTKDFITAMNDVLCTFLVYKASIHGVQAMANLMDFKNEHFQNLGQASYVSGMEKILAPLLLVHMRDREISERLLAQITQEVFVSFTNLVTPTGQSISSISYLHNFLTDNLA